MADEITVTMSITYAKGNVASFSRALTAKKVTVSGNRYVLNIQNIGTSEEALGIGELSAPLGWAWFHNLDDTNYVEIRLGTGASNDMIRLNAKEAALMRLGSDISAPYAIANTAAVDLEYLIFPP